MLTQIVSPSLVKISQYWMRNASNCHKIPYITILRKGEKWSWIHMWNQSWPKFNQFCVHAHQVWLTSVFMNYLAHSWAHKHTGWSQYMLCQRHMGTQTHRVVTIHAPPETHGHTNTQGGHNTCSARDTWTHKHTGWSQYMLRQRHMDNNA